MSDMSTGPSDTNPTARYDPPSTPPPPTIGPSTGVSSVPSPTPPPARWRRGDGNLGTVVFGAVLVALGLWFFADQTLGLDMPRLRWSEIWPVILIVVGGWILLASIRRR